MGAKWVQKIISILFLFRIYFKYYFNFIVLQLFSDPTNKFNRDVSMSIFKGKLKLFLLLNDIVLNYPK